MELQVKSVDCAIVGGGLAGLCLAIQLAEQGVSVIVFEKNTFPFHKVCGEYISMESWDFLTELGVPLSELNLPVIKELGISSEKGFMLNHSLQMGGFGISRYSLDHYLSKIAAQKGAVIQENCRVHSVDKSGDETFFIESTAGSYTARVVCGSYGKYTPAFLQPDKKPAHTQSGVNYIGVKYHIKSDLPANRIELHNFKDGYCGISKVDQDLHCLCYLTSSRNLLDNQKDIKQMEKNVLLRNPFLKRYFGTSEFIYSQPLVISNVQFQKKQTNVKGLFLLGDAAGSITPLCGNGMSMAMRSSKILAPELVRFLQNRQSMSLAAANYNVAWNKAFNSRITTGFYLRNLFGKRNTTDLALKVLDRLPGITNRLVSLTHGNTF